jgi:hypothetical protein
MPDNLKWRVGSKVPINVYEGETPVCQCQTVEYARRIVAAVNAAPEVLADTEFALSYGEGKTEELAAENALLRKALEKIFGIAHSGSSISHLARVALATAGRAAAGPLEPKE